MKLTHLRLGLGRRTACDVLFLRSGQVTDLEPHLAPHRYVDLEYGSRRVILHPIFLFFLLVNLVKYSTQRAFLKTYVQFYRTTSVISYDNIPGAWDWADVLEWPMISVQHGMRQMEEVNVESAPTTNVVFLSWGNLLRRRRTSFSCRGEISRSRTTNSVGPRVSPIRVMNELR